MTPNQEPVEPKGGGRLTLVVILLIGILVAAAMVLPMLWMEPATPGSAPTTASTFSTGR